eukprot:m51a1_g7830 putative C-tail anchored protein (213) ;mRNA; f:162753-163518
MFTWLASSPLLLLALLATPAHSRGTCHGCMYSFDMPQVPALAWGPDTVPDSVISANNTIRMAGGRPLHRGEGCNGFRVEYLNYTEYNGGAYHYLNDTEFDFRLATGSWSSHFNGTDGVERDLINIFYANGEVLRARKVQSWETNLFDELRGRTMRLWVTCNNGVESCLLFKIAPAEPQLVCCAAGTPQASAPAAALLLAVLAVAGLLSVAGV